VKVCERLSLASGKSLAAAYKELVYVQRSNVLSAA